MQYFVSIENCFYFRWQIELLLHSMKLAGLENQLVVACAEFENKKLKYPNVFYHENVGRKNNYLPINKIYSIKYALENKLLTTPFVVIDPDMVMKDPIPNFELNTADCSEYLNYDKLLKIGYCEKDLGCKQNWKPGSYVYFIKQHQNEIINKSLEKLYSFLNKDLQNVDRWQIEMVAVASCFSEHNATIKKLSSMLYDDETSNFVHYTGGYGPYFKKFNYNNLRDITFDYAYYPYKAILEITPNNQNIKILQSITNDFLKDKDMNYIYNI
jgi:hypothetical protein